MIVCIIFYDSLHDISALHAFWNFYLSSHMIVDQAKDLLCYPCFFHSGYHSVKIFKNVWAYLLYQIQKMWNRARSAVGMEHCWFHDLRRSFITNARRRGVQESVIMKMSGHKTRNVFERYNVVDETDLRNAVVMIEEGCTRELKEVAGG